MQCITALIYNTEEPSSPRASASGLLAIALHALVPAALHALTE